MEPDSAAGGARRAGASGPEYERPLRRAEVRRTLAHARARLLAAPDPSEGPNAAGPADRGDLQAAERWLDDAAAQMATTTGRATRARLHLAHASALLAVQELLQGLLVALVHADSPTGLAGYPTNRTRPLTLGRIVYQSLCETFRIDL